MSRENVEHHRRFYEAFNARDVEAMIACCDPGIEFHSMFAAAGGAVYSGHDGLRRWHQDLEDTLGHEVRVQTEAYFDLGEQTLARGALHGRGLHSGVEVDLEGMQVAKWRDGLMTYFESYLHEEDALSELGVSKDALDPISPDGPEI